MLFKEKTLNPLELLEKQKSKIKNKKYNQFNFDSNQLKKLKTEREDLKSEITELKASTQQWL